MENYILDSTLPIGSSTSRYSNHQILCDELSAAYTINELQQHILKLVKELGFSDFLFLRTNRNWYSDTQYGIMSSLPRELTDPYQHERLFEHDLVLSYCKDNVQPILASHIYDYIDNAPFDTALTRSNRTVLKSYQRFGYFDQYVVPIPAVNGHGNVMLSLLSRDVSKADFQNLVHTTGTLCRTLCKAIDQITTKRFRSQFICGNEQPAALTGKALQALVLLTRHDARLATIAEQMHVSPITAHQHISKARKALGVKTNIAAVVKALQLGLIRLG